MRALRIINSRSSYQEALQLDKISTLEDRRNELNMRTYDKITKSGRLCQNIQPRLGLSPMNILLVILTVGRLLNIKLFTICF